MEKLKEIVFAIFGIVAILSIKGFVLFKLWFWFIVSTFQLKELSIIECIGLVLLISYIKNKQNNKTENKNNQQELKSAIKYAFGNACWTLLIGWIIYIILLYIK